MRRAAWLLLGWLALAPAAAACPLCKEALFDPAQAKQAASTAKGYAISISLLLGMPVLLLSSVAIAVIRHRPRPSQRVDTQNRSA